MSINVWTNVGDTHGVVCADARLTDRSQTQWPWSDRPLASSDRLYGQTGWDVGVNFANIAELVSKLRGLHVPGYVPGGGRTVRRGDIRRLAIHTHGASGTIFINGQRGPDPLTTASLATHRAHLHQIGLMTPDTPENPAVILFVGCSAASGQPGTDLLTALSRHWPHRKVVAFATLGYAHGGEMLRSGEYCTEPGMRDTTALSPGEADATSGRYWGNLRDWPWASERSPRAKVALDGQIIRGANW